MLPTQFSSYHFKNGRDVRKTIEVFLDLVCPYSKKMFNTLEQNNVNFIFRHQVQPWHPQSCLLHYAVISVNKSTPQHTQKAISALFKHQESFFDDKTFDLSQFQIYSSIQAILEEEGIPFDLESIRVGDGNTGNSLGADFKYHLRISRQLGVHVSPTVYVDGLENSAISSSWTIQQWQTLIDK